MGYRHRTTVCAAAMVLALPLMDEAAGAVRGGPEAAAPAVRQDRVNPHAAEVAALQKRLDEYLKLHERVAGELTPLELSLWAVPTAIAAFAIHGSRLLRLDRRLRRGAGA